MNPPVVLSSTYVGTAPPGPDELVYTRLGTETWLPFEETLAALERSSRPALLFGSGMAAIAATLSLLPPGGVVVIPRHSYHATLVAARDLRTRTGVEVREVDVVDTAACVAAVHGADRWAGRPASLVWVESPTNPMLEIADLPALAAAAREVGALIAVDNTFATPLAQRPLELGADVVVHSVTKYLSGHSDVVLGAALTNDPGLHERLRMQRSIGGVDIALVESHCSAVG